LAPAIAALEGATALDETAGRLSHLASRVTAGKRGSVLRGNWLGHALHPLMTDFPLGCWLSAGLLDLSCSKTYRRAAQRLVGLGVAFAVPTAITGIADYAVITDRRAKRVGVVHMLGNTGVLVFYAASWRARRRGHHWRGVAWAMAGGSGAWVTGYLGGHLSFARQVGTGQRGMDIDRPLGGAESDGDSEASELLANRT
jgi:uncharacterized membrane protein